MLISKDAGHLDRVQSKLGQSRHIPLITWGLFLMNSVLIAFFQVHGGYRQRQLIATAPTTRLILQEFILQFYNLSRTLIGWHLVALQLKFWILRQRLNLRDVKVLYVMLWNESSNSPSLCLQPVSLTRHCCCFYFHCVCTTLTCCCRWTRAH